MNSKNWVIEGSTLGNSEKTRKRGGEVEKEKGGIR